MAIKSCEKCGKTIITDEQGKVLVGCDHYGIDSKNNPFNALFGSGDNPFDNLFNNKK